MRNEPEAVDRLPSAAGPESGIPVRPPWFVTIIAVAALAFALFTTPERLLAAGRLRWYLTEAGEKVRWLTETEIALFRIICAGIALLPCVWGPIARSSFVRRVHHHEPRERGWIRSRKTLFNFSLIASLSCAALALAYSVTAGQFLTPEQRTLIDDEDGVVEYGTALFFLGGSLLAALLAYRSRAGTWRAAIFLLFAALFFLMCGEEISWGQRIFGVQTPELIREKNSQGETNIHNMLGFLLDHIFLLGILTYGAVFPLLAWRFPFFHKFFDYVELPIGSLGLAVGFLAATFLWVGTALLGTHPELRVEELRELLSSLCLFLLLVETWRKEPEDREPTHAAAPS